MKYRELLEHKRERIKRFQEDLNEHIQYCPHGEDGEKWIEEKSKYFSGSYYDTSYTEYWVECKVCGATSEIKTINHGSYG